MFLWYFGLTMMRDDMHSFSLTEREHGQLTFSKFLTSNSPDDTRTNKSSHLYQSHLNNLNLRYKGFHKGKSQVSEAILVLDIFS